MTESINHPKKRLLYPVDTASFEGIIERKCVYVDKTAYVDSLVTQGKYYFLARPRRFGKSMLLSTLEAYFLNKRELFQGLAIDSLQPQEWNQYPVLRFDLTGVTYNSPEKLLSSLNQSLVLLAEKFGVQMSGENIEDKFYSLISKAADKTNKKVVILVDEYDAPLTETIDKPELQELYREQLHGFYSVLKKADEHIRFCMLTGVTRYGKVSVFSGLNNLNDITFANQYAGICGITEEELHTFYQEGVREFAASEGVTVDEAYGQLKFFYDGYHFTRSMLDIYNPFSLNLALSNKEIDDYWCKSGAPTVFIKHLRERDFDLESLNGKSVTEGELSNLSMYGADPVPLFFQTGYLTLKSYDKEDGLFTIGYPNREVERGILRNILQVYTPVYEGSLAVYLRRSLKEGDPERFIALLKEFLAGIPADLHTHVGKYENYYHTVIYSLLKLVGIDVAAEYSTCKGYMDLLLKTKDYIYIIELKINGTAEDAIRQINEKEYAAPFASDPRRLYKIGIGFSKDTRNITSYIIE